MKPQVQADELNHEIIDVDHGDMGRLVWHTITQMGNYFRISLPPLMRFLLKGPLPNISPKMI